MDSRNSGTRGRTNWRILGATIAQSRRTCAAIICLPSPRQSKTTSCRSSSRTCGHSHNTLALRLPAILDEKIMGLKQGRWNFTPQDRAAYLEAWSRPDAITGALNYYRAAQIGPMVNPSASRPLVPQLKSVHVRVPTLV